MNLCTTQYYLAVLDKLRNRALSEATTLGRKDFSARSLIIQISLRATSFYSPKKKNIKTITPMNYFDLTREREKRVMVSLIARARGLKKNPKGRSRVSR